MRLVSNKTFMCHVLNMAKHQRYLDRSIQFGKVWVIDELGKACEEMVPLSHGRLNDMVPVTCDLSSPMLPDSANPTKTVQKDRRMIL